MCLCFCLCLCPSRIYEILPQRIQQWQQSPCVAEEMGRRQLERIRREQQAARLRLTLMEKRFHELEGIIANAKLQQVQHHEEVWHTVCLSDGSLSVYTCLSLSDLCFSVWPACLQVTEGDGDDTDLQIFCVSCSHPINPKVALRHMERCYAKVSVETGCRTGVSMRVVTAEEVWLQLRLTSPVPGLKPPSKFSIDMDKSVYQ